MSGARLAEHFFRHEYGNLIAVLSRRVGMRHIKDVEDAVQSALMSALDMWTVASVPDKPQAWLFRVAYNNLMGELRQRAGRHRLLEQAAGLAEAAESLPEIHFAAELDDDLLRMLFACCDESIPAESQLVLALKTLCGFSVREIALRLFASEAHVYKRFSRARRRLKAVQFRTEELADEQYSSRLGAVHKILYLMFAEGHLSSCTDMTLRRELCDDAIRLTTILCGHPVGQTPETFALLAMMHLHVARMNARVDAFGHLLLLEEQDRSRWDQQHIQMGMEWLARSARGDRFSRYHAEAGIAAEHCRADSFAQTRWDTIVEYYSLLERIAPSELHTLNRAVAVAEWRTPADGLAILSRLDPPEWLASSYMWSAVLSDLHRRCGNAEAADRYAERACAAAPTLALRELLRRRLQMYPSPPLDA